MPWTTRLNRAFSTRTEADLAAAETRLARWRAAVARGAGPGAGPVVEQVRAALSDDLDAPAALRAVDAWADRAVAGQGDDQEAGGEVARAVDALLGVDLAATSG